MGYCFFSFFYVHASTLMDLVSIWKWMCVLFFKYLILCILYCFGLSGRIKVKINGTLSIWWKNDIPDCSAFSFINIRVYGGEIT